MPKTRKLADLEVLEGGGAGGMGGGGGRSSFTFDRITGSKSARDHKENAPNSRTKEISGELSFKETPKRSSSDRTPRTSDDYAKGGAVSASKRADGIAQRGKTRGKMC
jgi:hypothetical protein